MNKRPCEEPTTTDSKKYKPNDPRDGRQFEHYNHMTYEEISDQQIEEIMKYYGYSYKICVHKDIKLIMCQCKCSIEHAIISLFKNNEDIVDTIITNTNLINTIQHIR